MLAKGQIVLPDVISPADAQFFRYPLIRCLFFSARIRPGVSFFPDTGPDLPSRLAHGWQRYPRSSAEVLDDCYLLKRLHSLQTGHVS